MQDGGAPVVRVGGALHVTGLDQRRDLPTRHGEVHVERLGHVLDAGAVTALHDREREQAAAGLKAGAAHHVALDHAEAVDRAGEGLEVLWGGHQRPVLRIRLIA